MKLKTKLYITIIPFLLVIVFSTYLIVDQYVGRLKTTFIERVTEKSAILDTVLYYNSKNPLTIISEVYGLWSDMAAYAEHPSTEFEDYNLYWLLKKYDLNAVWVYNKNKEMIFTYNTDPNIYKNFLPFSDDYFDYILTYGEDNSYQYQKEKLVELFSSSLHYNQKAYEAGIYNGFIIAARSYDGKLITNLESILGGEISITKSQPSIQDTYSTTRESDIIIKKFSDWREHPVANMQVKVNSEIFDSVLKSSILLLVLFVAFTVITGLIFLLFINRIFNKPLQLIEKSLKEKEVKYLEKLPDRKDEFGQFASILAEYFEQTQIIENEISIRKKAENELAKLNLNLEKRIAERTREIQSILDQSPLAIALFDIKGKIINRNRTFDTYFGQILSDDKNLEKIWIALNMHSLNIDEKIRGLVNKAERFSIENFLLNAEQAGILGFSSEVIFKIQLYPVQDDSGKVYLIVLTLENRTEVIQAHSINERINQYRKISEAAIEVQESERYRISSELHDGIGQMLMAAGFQLDKYIDNEVAENDVLKRIKSTLSKIGSELSNIIHDLHPIDLNKYGLDKSLRSLCAEFSRLSTLKIVYSSYNLPENLPKQVELSVYRITQEVLRNTQKYAKASKLSIDLLFRDNTLIVQVEDDGIGFNVHDALAGGQGIKNIFNRIEFLNGVCNIETGRENGTIINIRIPVNVRN